jgi:hypothetical protein
LQLEEIELLHHRKLDDAEVVAEPLDEACQFRALPAAAMA